MRACVCVCEGGGGGCVLNHIREYASFTTTQPRGNREHTHKWVWAVVIGTFLVTVGFYNDQTKAKIPTVQKLPVNTGSSYSLLVN